MLGKGADGISGYGDGSGGGGDGGGGDGGGGGGDSGSGDRGCGGGDGGSGGRYVRDRGDEEVECRLYLFGRRNSCR